jgi:hypothetical protein
MDSGLGKHRNGRDATDATAYIRSVLLMRV